MLRSLWREEALAGEEDAPPLEGDVLADVCICGGGYSGLWAAIWLKEHEPTLDVVLLEADVCGGGASGRNGGFVPGPYARFPPEPVRSVGGRVVRAAVERKERREDEGGQAGWLTTRLAAFAPPVFVPAPRGSSASAH